MKKSEGNLDQLERDLFRVQKSTKTLFSPFIPVHNWLRMHSKWYYNWHLHEYTRGIHLGILVVYLVIVSIVIRNHFVVVSYAAGNTVTQTTQADWQAGSADSNVDLTSAPGDVTLKNDANPLTHKYGDFYAGDTSGSFLSPSVGANVTSSGAQLPAADSWMYTSSSSPVALSNNSFDAVLDSTHNRLYIGIISGVEVVDTKGTPDPSDDVLVGTFNHASVSQMPNYDSINHLTLDTTNNLLYISSLGDGGSNNGGVVVIHVHPTVSNLSSDTVVANYAGLTNQGGQRVTLDLTHNLVYIPYNQGIEVVDTKGTPYDSSDDTTSTPYGSATTPISFTNANIEAVQIDPSTNYLYVQTVDFTDRGEVIVIDTKGTTSTSDDVVVRHYNSTTTPSTVSSCSSTCGVKGIGLDTTNHLLYASSYVNGGASTEVAVINVQTNTLVTRYTAPFTYFQFVFDPNHHRVWLNGLTATSILDTKGTSDTSDDTITTYNASTNPILNGGGVSTIDPTTGYGYAPDGGGTPSLTIFSPDVKRYSTDNAGFVGGLVEVPSQPYNKLTWSRTGGAGQTTGVETQTATASTLYNYDFTKGDTSIVTDHYNWGTVFQNASESNGVLTLTNPTQPTFNYADTWLESNQPDGTFPAGSVVTMRVKLNGPESPSCDPQCNYFAVFADDWSDGNFVFHPDTTDHEWHTISFTASAPFTRVGFEFDWQKTWDNAQNNVQIDSVNIYSPPTWSSWSSACSTNAGCSIDTSGKALMQYRFTLGTNDVNQTPTISDVTLHQGYPTSGTFTSSVIDAGDSVTWTTLTPDQATPTNTSLTFSARSGNTSTPDGTWSNWQVISGTTLSVPDGRYVQYKAVLASTDVTATPTIHGVTVAYLPIMTATPSAAPSTTVVTTNSPSTTATPTPVGAPLLTLTSVDGTTLSGSINTVRLAEGITAPSFSGKTDAGATVVVKADDKEICRATGKSDGTWTCQPTTPLTSGTYKISIVATSTKNVATTLPTFNLLVTEASSPSPEENATTVPTPVAEQTEPTFNPVILPYSAQVRKNVSGNVVFSQLKISLTNPNGQPLAFVPVTLYSTPQTVTTDKNGIATFSNVLAGDHHIQYAVNKVATNVTPITIAVNESNGKPSQVTIAVKPSQLVVPLGPTSLHWNIWYLLYLPALLYAVWLVVSEIKSRIR